MTSTAPAGALGARVRRGLAWSALSTVTLRVGGFLVGIVLARVLGPSEFGVYAVALTVQAVLVTLADLGLSADLIRSHEPERLAPTVGLLSLVAGGVLTAGMVATAPLVATAMGSPQSGPVVAVLSTTLLLAGAGVVPYAALQRAFEQKKIFSIAVVDFVVGTAVTLGLLAAGWGAMALAVGRVAAQLVTLVLQFAVTRTRPRFGLDRAVLRPTLLFGLPVAGANLLSWALLNVDNVVVARLLGSTALGFYVLAFNISNWPMSAIGQVVRSVALPAFAVQGRARTDQGRSTGDDLSPAVGLAAAAALPAGVLLAALATPVVRVVYGDVWRPSVPVLAALGLFGAMRVLFDLFASYLLARGRSRAVLLVQVVWFVALVVGVVVGARGWGIAGAGWAHLVVALVVVLPAYVWALRGAGVPWRPLGRALLRPASTSALAGVAAGGLAHVVSAPAVSLVVGCVVGGAVYAALTLRWFRGAVAGLRRGTADVEPDPASEVASPVEVDPVTPGPTVAGAALGATGMAP
ncbi:MAG: hypothetical protein B7X41_03135 [Microbacterium sp. 14-71-5]|nr:MAG: hypothetical protein B7X41_03135 [Microbacterium sp. 14-71-5]